MFCPEDDYRGHRFGKFAATDSYERGLFALSGDGIHNGHLDIIKKAAARCKELIVLIAINLEKDRGLFTLVERIKMAERAIKLTGLKNVRVVGTDGLMVDAYLKYDCDVYFRGIRNEQDRIAEILQHDRNLLIYPEVRMAMFDADPRFELVSSSALKGFVSVDATPPMFAPTFVTAAIEERLTKQIRIGVVGRMASGKTTVTKALAYALNWTDRRTVVIDFDDLIRELYAEKSAGAQQVRDRLGELFGLEVLNADYSNVNRKYLKKMLFDRPDSTQNRVMVNALTKPHVMRLYRAKLRELRTAFKGILLIVLVEGAMLVEMEMTHLVSHRIISVESDQALHARLLESRGIPQEIAEGVLKTQLPVESKKSIIQGMIDEGGFGFFHQFENEWSEDGPSVDRLANTLTQLIKDAQKVG